MAINRTPWTALVDDDGSNLTGTIWNKDKIKTVLLDPIDAFVLGPVQVGTKHATATLSAGNYDNYRAPDGENCYLWLLNPQGPQSLTGVLAEADYTQHLFVNISSNNIVFYNQHANSVAANRFICPGYNHYTLGVWGSLTLTYVAAIGAWIIHKAT